MDVAEDFLHEVFEGDKAGGAAEFVDDHGDGAFLGQQAAHHGVGHQRFGSVENRMDVLAPVARRVEKLRHMDVAEDVVDVLAVDYDFRAAGRSEEFRQRLAVGVVDVDGHEFVAGRHAVAQVGRREVECVPEYLHLVFYGLFFVLKCVDGFFEIGVEVAHRQQAYCR